MVQIVGKYEHVSNSPNLEGYLKVLVSTDETMIKNLVAGKPTLTISETEGQWTIQTSEGGRSSSVTFKLGEPYDEIVGNGVLLKKITTRDGDKLITETKVHDTCDTTIYEFSDAGITVHMIHAESDSKASAVYKRV